MTTISHVHAREILDSRGNPTVEADVFLTNGMHARAAVPERRQHGRERSGGTPRRRRRALRRQGCADGRAERRGDHRAGHCRHGSHAAAGDRRGDDRTRRHREQIEPRRQRDPRRLDGQRPRRRAAHGSAPVPLSGRPAGARDARADDERGERRRARGQQRGLPGVHDRAGGRGVVHRGAAHGGRGVPRPQEGALASGSSPPASATRAASPPTWPTTRRRCAS